MGGVQEDGLQGGEALPPQREEDAVGGQVLQVERRQVRREEIRVEQAEEVDKGEVEDGVREEERREA